MKECAVPPLVTSLLDARVELVRHYFELPGGTSGRVRAVYLSDNPDREDVGGPRSFVYCLVQTESGGLVSIEATYLRVVSEAS
jgi:hypothetical protein